MHLPVFRIDAAAVKQDELDSRPECRKVLELAGQMGRLVYTGTTVGLLYGRQQQGAGLCGVLDPAPSASKSVATAMPFLASCASDIRDVS